MSKTPPRAERQRAVRDKLDRSAKGTPTVERERAICDEIERFEKRAEVLMNAHGFKRRTARILQGLDLMLLSDLRNADPISLARVEGVGMATLQEIAEVAEWEPISEWPWWKRRTPAPPVQVPLPTALFDSLSTPAEERPLLMPEPPPRPMPLKPDRKMMFAGMLALTDRLPAAKKARFEEVYAAVETMWRWMAEERP